METENNFSQGDLVIMKLDSLSNKLSMDNHEEEFLKNMLTEDNIKGLGGVTLTECHVIDCIERNRLINAIGIARKLNITKGGISRISARLLKKGLIESHHLEGNRKELFYTLTPAGKKIFKVHERLHKKVHEKLIAHIGKYTEDELNCVNKFLSDVIEII